MKDNYQLRLFKQISDKPLFTTAYHPSEVKQMSSILKACRDIPQIYREIEDSYVVLREMLKNFHKFVVTSKRRYSNREYEANQYMDEYDVQDGIESLLRLIFKDVRREDYVPSRAGGNSRSDFNIIDVKTVLEVKYVTSNMSDRRLGEEMVIDIERYKGNTSYEKVLFFVYDPDTNIKNSQGLRDIELSNSNVEVIISP